ncbi:MAG: hypothetical protein H0W74_03540 [Sphingosinicella sp.]|nr:hypothetical protein [Sphingosinicella sp.]
MKSIITAALVASQIAAAATPAMAATIEDHQMASQRSIGGFAGARFRMPLGAKEKKPEIGFALTTIQRNGPSGTMRFSQGVELGVSGNGTAGFSIAGRLLRPQSATLVSRPGEAPKGQKAGVSTIGWVLIGVGTLAVLAVGALVICQETNCTNSD